MPENFRYNQTAGLGSLDSYSTLYTTSSSAQAVISTIAVCNTASTNSSYRIGILNAAATPSASNFLVYNATAPANDTVFLTVGISLQQSQFIRISSASTVVFTAFVSEIT